MSPEMHCQNAEAAVNGVQASVHEPISEAEIHKFNHYPTANSGGKTIRNTFVSNISKKTRSEVSY